MKQGELSNYFVGVAAKRLTESEVDPNVSNQHEFQGVASLKKILGDQNSKLRIPAEYLWLDDENNGISLSSFVTWSDVRRDNKNRSAEYHLYYSSLSEEIVYKAKPGDLLVIAKSSKEKVFIIICPKGSSIENQLILLFGISSDLQNFQAKSLEDQELSFASKYILSELGIEIDETDDNFLEEIIRRFDAKFPPTKVFSQFARDTLPAVSCIEDPDKALIEWIEREELLFKTLEEYIVSNQLDEGFQNVEEFISYSLSVQNRRKSRMGHAFENHVHAIFQEYGILYSSNAITENKSRPDFLIPSEEKYHQDSYPSDCLIMLGVKSSCKDRWRQVLSEADRIKNKHLLTLEPGISINQTNEMQSNNLQLVLPNQLHDTYVTKQQDYIINISDFLEFVIENQENCSS